MGNCISRFRESVICNFPYPVYRSSAVRNLINNVAKENLNKWIINNNKASSDKRLFKVTFVVNNMNYV